VMPGFGVNHRVYPCEFCHVTVCKDCMRFIGDLHLCRSCGDRLSQTRGTQVDVALMRDRFHNPLRGPLETAVRVVPGLSAWRAGRFGPAGFHLTVVAFLVWWIALMGTIPEWSIGVSGGGWPVARLGAAMALLLYVAFNGVLTMNRSRVDEPVESDEPHLWKWNV